MHVSQPFLREFYKARETRPLGCSAASPLLQLSPLFQFPLPLPRLSLPLCHPSSCPVWYSLFPQLACGITQSLSPPPTFFLIIFITWHFSFLPFYLATLMPWVPLCPISNLSLFYFILYSLPIIHNPCMLSLSHTHTQSSTPVKSDQKIFPGTFCSYSDCLFPMAHFNGILWVQFTNCSALLTSDFVLIELAATKVFNKPLMKKKYFEDFHGDTNFPLSQKCNTYTKLNKNAI